MNSPEGDEAERWQTLLREIERGVPRKETERALRELLLEESESPSRCKVIAMLVAPRRGPRARVQITANDPLAAHWRPLLGAIERGDPRRNIERAFREILLGESRLPSRKKAIAALVAPPPKPGARKGGRVTDRDPLARSNRENLDRLAIAEFYAVVRSDKTLPQIGRSAQKHISDCARYLVEKTDRRRAARPADRASAAPADPDGHRQTVRKHLNDPAFRMDWAAARLKAGDDPFLFGMEFAMRDCARRRVPTAPEQ